MRYKVNQNTGDLNLISSKIIIDPSSAEIETFEDGDVWGEKDTYFLFIYTKFNGNIILLNKIQIQPAALKFSSDDDFILYSSLSGNPFWDGVIEYSLDNCNTWNEWDGSQLTGTSSQPIYLRGTGNSKMTGHNTYGGYYSWFFSGKYITGNIETLLDYQTVIDGLHPMMGDYCYAGMFYNSDLITPPELSAITLTPHCYESMFNGCRSLVTTPKLPATTLADSCCSYMFANCSSLTTILELSATTLAQKCYEGMFKGCDSLITTPELPATTLANYCYESMFEECGSLTTISILPATTLENGCYENMFRSCQSLTTVISSILPATTLADRCYYGMFKECYSLAVAPELPATTLANSCYEGMFDNCILIVAPELPATILAERCYCGMFTYNLLTIPPELPATTLANSCYYGMFFGCSSLATLPKLPATVLVEDCYHQMFKYCNSIKLSTTRVDDYQYEYSIPSLGTGTDATDALSDMFVSTGGSFTGTPTINTTYYTDHQPI